MVSITTIIQNSLLSSLFALHCQSAAIIPNCNQVVPVDFQVSYHDRFDDKDLFIDNEFNKDEGLAKRDYIKTNLKRRKSYYTTELKIGSQKKKVKVVIDTGSSDLWVPSSEAKCLDNSKCRSEGVYSVEKSKTAKKLNQPFEIEYPDDTSASGVYVQDTVRIGKKTISQQQFAVVDKSSAKMGALGIGLKSDEETSDNSTYDNFVFNLKKQGLINKAGYSLYLPEKEKKSGTILFGGIDEDKCSGNLTKFIVSSDKLAVPLQSVSFENKNYKNDTEAIIDSGSTFSYLPTNIVDGISDLLNGSYSDKLGVYVVDCKNRRKKSGYITFNFNNETSILAPLSHFVDCLKKIKSHVPDHEKNHCGLSILRGDGDGETILGDNFLRSAYVSVDLEDKTVGLAQVKHSKHHSYKGI
ncbi:hypothetical protein CORT_0F03710 [Candida orthopsilosis Co 90-125]|uniref:candidapepsin n=1 Tax=Candida orthopsilosis (strain 90-125) TaxID=1136231 RepID=H8X9C8_CANO9|nr:hypothetical protein CORT_0F03710 [Candida orthopsilosis Co 90-125]CCG24594.1 hypothetical protein CORT_0F03710 [Candida orthopsilosis Co 90-125]